MDNCKDQFGTPEACRELTVISDAEMNRCVQQPQVQERVEGVCTYRSFTWTCLCLTRNQKQTSRPSQDATPSRMVLTPRRCPPTAPVLNPQRRQLPTQPRPSCNPNPRLLQPPWFNPSPPHLRVLLFPSTASVVEMA
jgi:hypothetical protein